MKLCYISSTFFSDTDLGIIKSLSGSHTVCYAVVVPCKSNNYTIAQLNEALAECGPSLIVKEVVVKRRLKNPLNLISYFKWLKDIAISSYDVVYINNTEDLFLSLLLRLFLGKKPVVYGVHDAISHSGWRSNFLMRMANRMMLNRSGSLLAFSKAQSDVLIQKFPQKKIFTIPLAIKNFGLAKSGTVSYTTINFLFFGNIASYKGLDLLLKAVKSLSASYNNFSLIIAGRCADWSMGYEPLIDAGMPVQKHIRFIDNSEIPAFFSAAHYLVLPYRDVTQSGPLMIGYNYSLPALVSKLEGFTEVMKEGETGFFFEAENIADMSNVIEAAIIRKKESYEQLRKNVESYAKRKFGIETISNQYYQMFQQVALSR